MVFDATSLYPSAMVSIKSFPSLDGSVVLKSDFDINDDTYKHYIIKCDVFLP